MSQFMIDFMHEYQYLAVFALLFAENLFPPIPSEVILPLAGKMAEQHELDTGWLLVASTAGSLAGALFWYVVGRHFQNKATTHFINKQGRWLTFTVKDYEHSLNLFKKYGGLAVCLCRMIPTLRTMISIPAGIIRMPLPRFLVYSTVGTALWNSLLIAAGYLLQEKLELASSTVNTLSNAIIAGIVAYYLYRLLQGYGRAGDDGN